MTTPNQPAPRPPSTPASNASVSPPERASPHRAAQAALRWRPDSPARQHLIALVLAVILPALLHLSTTAPGPGQGLLAFAAIALGFVSVAAGLLLYLWWVHAAWLHRDDESWAAPWRLGQGPTAIGRHPGWLAVIAMTLGQALIAPSLWLCGYAVLVVVGLNLLVRRYDEPNLRQAYGEDYDAYQERVQRWLPWSRVMQTLREIGQMIGNTIRSR